MRSFALLFFCLVTIVVPCISQDLKAKVNSFIQSQKRVGYLEYSDPEGIPYGGPTGLGGGGKVETVWRQNNILYRKNNLPDKRIPANYISYYFFKYKDSVECAKALEAFLSNPPLDYYKKLIVGEDVEGVKAAPMMMIVNKTEIIIAHTQCNFYYNTRDPGQKSTLWTMVEADILEAFGIQNSIVMYVGCGGPIRWK